MSKAGGTRKHDAQLTALQERIGYSFDNLDLLREAMTHGSALDGARGKRHSYDRLEFLGDRVLGLVVAARLLRDDKTGDEGELAPRLNALVNRHACAAAARSASAPLACAEVPRSSRWMARRWRGWRT